MLLANTYHLALRPGEEVVARAGRPARVHGLGRADPDRLGRVPGLQPGGPAPRSPTTGVTFRSHLDGRLLELTPERAVAIQEALGADVAMCLDHCPALPAVEGGDRRRPSTGRSAGPGGARRPTRGPTRPSSGSSRGEPTPTSAPSAPRPWSRSTSTATPSAASASARAARRSARRSR